MGHIPNKTYTTPDGSMYRVEPDGSVTRIKIGNPISNESPSKYQITPDGKIYRVEEDGSVTNLGNAEDRTGIVNPTLSKKSKHYWIWIISILLMGLILHHILVCYIDHHEFQYEKPIMNELSPEETDVENPTTESPVDENASNKTTVEDINENIELINDEHAPYYRDTGISHLFSDVKAKIVGNNVIVSFSYYIKDNRNATYSIGVNGSISGFYYEYDIDVECDVVILPTNAIHYEGESKIPNIMISLCPHYRSSGNDFGGGTVQVEIPFDNLINSEYELESIDYWIHLYKNDKFVYKKDYNNKID